MIHSTASAQRTIVPMMIVGAALAAHANSTTTANWRYSAPLVNSSVGTLTQIRPEFGSNDDSPWLSPERYAKDVPETDGWLAATMLTINNHVNSTGRWSQIHSRTEELAALFATMPASKRPSLLVDEDGIPNFAMASNDVYFHLTLDSPEMISWIYEGGGQDCEGESVPFDGTRLPEDLAAAFA